MIILNLSTLGELLLIVALCLAFGPAVSELLGKLGAKVIIDWMFGGENPTPAQRKNFKAVAIVLALVGLFCWLIGDSKTNYNGLFILLGYILFFLAYIRYHRSNGHAELKKQEPGGSKQTENK